MYTIWFHIELVIGIIILFFMIREVYFPAKKKEEPLPVDWKNEFDKQPDMSDVEYWAAFEHYGDKEKCNEHS